MSQYSNSRYVIHTDRFGVEPRMFLFSRDAHAEAVALSKRVPYRHAEVHVSIVTFTVNGDRITISDQKVICSIYVDGRYRQPTTNTQETTTA